MLPNAVPKPVRSEKKPRKPIQRGAKPRAVNPKRRRETFKADFHSKAFVEFLHALPCAICGVEGFSQAAHIVSRGAGGKAANNLVPLCGSAFGVDGCHAAFDKREPTARRHELRLKLLAKKLWSGWVESQDSAGSRRA